MKRADLRLVEAVERSETDLAMAIADGRADVGLGIAAAARQFKLDFAPLIEERFDLLVWRKAYFDPPFQKLVALCLSEAFRDKAKALGGYDVSGFGRFALTAKRRPRPIGGGEGGANVRPLSLRRRWKAPWSPRLPFCRDETISRPTP